MVTPRPSWRHLLTWRRVLLVAALALLAGLLVGCFGVTKPPPAPPIEHAPKPSPPVAEPLPVPKDETPEAKQVRQLRAQLAHHEGEAASLRNQLNRAEETKRQAEQEARLAPVRTAIAWVTWIGFLAGVAGVALRIALAFWSLPIGAGTAYALAFGGPAVALVAQGFGLVLPWLAIAGLVALVLAALALAFLALRRWATAHRLQSVGYQALAARLADYDPEERARLDLEDIKRQIQAKVLTINDRALGKLPAPQDGA